MQEHEKLTLRRVRKVNKCVAADVFDGQKMCVLKKKIFVTRTYEKIFCVKGSLLLVLALN